ncbi:MAG TPA: AEC family transporter [Deltaproteobacteria bacterium]|jgi:predicted permease|nr:AEC family transporter [Deltaproteobacteria bacterium]
MLNIILNAILPIFSIILLGFILKWRNIIDDAFARTANLIVFNIGIPAMLLSEIARAPFSENFNLRAVICSLGSLCIVLLSSMLAVRALSIRADRRGTFLQNSIHGNIGYMAYAIAYYAIGESSFARMAILSSFLMVGQNLLSVWALTSCDPEAQVNGRKWWLVIRNIVQNPIVLTVGVAIIFAALGLKIPGPLSKGLDILAGMALPTALLLIGASLSFGAMKSMVTEILAIGTFKLLALPLVGYSLMLVSKVPGPLILPGVILLASPPATISYVMATELGGDPELAAASVSVFTLASALSYTLILSFLA